MFSCFSSVLIIRGCVLRRLLATTEAEWESRCLPESCAVYFVLCGVFCAVWCELCAVYFVPCASRSVYFAPCKTCSVYRALNVVYRAVCRVR